jgi:hypothetical protein
VCKTQKTCDPTNPDDDHCSDDSAHLDYDPEHKLVLAVIPAARSTKSAAAIVTEVKERLGGEPAGLMTSDEYPADETAIGNTFGEPISPGRQPSRPRLVPERRMPGDRVYATVHKQGENNRVVAVEQRQVFGSGDELEEALGESRLSYVVDASFVERQGATDRGAQYREVPQDIPFQQGLGGPQGEVVRGAVQQQLLLMRADATRQGRRPAISGAITRAGGRALTDHIWTRSEWFGRPAVQSA